MRCIVISVEDRRRRGEIWSLLETKAKRQLSSTVSTRLTHNTTIETIESWDKESRTYFVQIRFPQSSRNFRNLSSKSIDLAKPPSRLLPSISHRFHPVSLKSRMSTSNSKVSQAERIVSRSEQVSHFPLSVAFLFLS